MKGLFIAFEGIDGCGKKTQLNLVREWIETITDRRVESSSEPNDDEKTGSPLGKLIRQMLDGRVKYPSDPLEFQRMFVLDRAQDVFALIQPALAAGKTYLIERFALSTFSYGMAAGLSFSNIARLHDKIICSRFDSSFFWFPDLTIVLDLEVKDALQRLKDAGRGNDVFEKREFLTRVRANYHTLARSNNNYSAMTEIVDANRPIVDVFLEIQRIIKKVEEM